MPEQVARFEILGILGTGGCAVVALARDRADASSEPVALKVLRHQKMANPWTLVRLREEARMLAWLRHPNIVRVHRLLEKDGRPVVVMEYIRGASVSEQFTNLRHGLPVNAALEIARKCALALLAAQVTAGPTGAPMQIVHRDIKPGNLLVTVQGEVKVVDFGIAVGGLGQDGGPLMGTRGYAAPERRFGGPDTPAVDVYALGVTLFEMLTGRHMVRSPMEADAHDASVRLELQALAPPGGIDVAALRDVIGRMCSFDPTARPALGEVVDRLCAIVPPGVDLRPYAAAHVRPLHEARCGRMPGGYDPGPDLAFLRASGPVMDAAVATSGPTRGLALRPETPVNVEPLLAALARKPWWERDGRDRGRMVDALRSLCGTRDARVMARARELTEHPDATIVDAAWDVLIAAA